jgi:hypothetical protein
LAWGIISVLRAQVVILTSVVNLITTGVFLGIVIYVIQKKIDANIQKSLFEHQTKFARLHEKRAEVLETLYKKTQRLFTNRSGNGLRLLLVRIEQLMQE